MTDSKVIFLRPSSRLLGALRAFGGVGHSPPVSIHGPANRSLKRASSSTVRSVNQSFSIRQVSGTIKPPQASKSQGQDPHPKTGRKGQSQKVLQRVLKEDAGPMSSSTGKRKLASSDADTSNGPDTKKADTSGSPKLGGGEGGAPAPEVAAAGTSTLETFERALRGQEPPQSADAMVIKRCGRLSGDDKERYIYRMLLARAMKENDIPGAERYYKEARDKSALTKEMYNLLLSLMSTHNQFAIVQQLYDDMKKIGLPDTEPAYTCVMRCFAQEGRPEEAEALLDAMVASKIRTKIRCYSYIIHAYARLHKADQAFAVYERMKADGLEATDGEFAALARVLAATEESDESPRALALLEDMRQTLPELAGETIEALGQWFSKTGALVARPATVADSGMCTSCGDVLAAVDLDDAGVTSLMEKLDKIVREDPLRVARWEEFCGKLGTLQFDVIIDGANIGYYKPNLNTGTEHVNYEQIDMVVEHLIEQGRKPLLVLQYRHLKYDWVPQEYHGLIRKWKSQDVLLVCPLKSNDDWYWMYAALNARGKIAVITNDQMRDHTFQMLAQRDFTKWKDRHLARFYMETVKRKRKIKILWPTEYSRCIQQTASGWHFPEAIPAPPEAAEKDAKGGEVEEPEVIEADKQPWLCVRVKRSASKA